jgi:hypothetical protein
MYMHVFTQNPELRGLMGSTFAEFQLLFHCLFDLPTSTDVATTAPKCKSSEVRLAAFELLNSLCDSHPGNLRHVAALLETNHLAIHSGKDWQYDHKAHAENGEKSGRQPVSICYG